MKLNRKEFVPGDGFPYFLLSILSSSIIASGISISGLFPYISFMVVDFRVVDDINNSGYYSGYVISSFMVGRVLSSYPWGRTADNIGRKKVLLIGLVSISLFSVLFGLAKSIWYYAFMCLEKQLVFHLLGLRFSPDSFSDYLIR